MADKKKKRCVVKSETYNGLDIYVDPTQLKMGEQSSPTKEVTDNKDDVFDKTAAIKRLKL